MRETYTRMYPTQRRNGGGETINLGAQVQCVGDTMSVKGGEGGRKWQVWNLDTETRQYRPGGQEMQRNVSTNHHKAQDCKQKEKEGAYHVFTQKAA